MSGPDPFTQQATTQTSQQPTTVETTVVQSPEPTVVVQPAPVVTPTNVSDGTSIQETNPAQNTQATEPTTTVDSQPASENNKLKVDQLEPKIDANTSILQIQNMVGNLERKSPLSHKEVLQLTSLKNKMMSAERDNKPVRPTEEPKENDFKAQQGDLIEYMYDKWILGSINWLLKKTDKYIRKGGNWLLDRYGNKSLKDNEVTTQKLKDQGKSTEVAKDSFDIEAITIGFTKKYLERLEAQNKNILDSFTALKDLDPNDPKDVLKIKKMFGDEKGSELVGNLSGVDKEKKDELVDRYIRYQENSHTIDRTVIETSSATVMARAIHDMASDKKFLNGFTPEQIENYIQDKLTRNIVDGLRRAHTETRELDGEGVSAYLEKMDKQAQNAYDQSKKNIAEGNTWENDKIPENPYVKVIIWDTVSQEVRNEIFFNKGETLNVLDLNMSQETLNKKTLDKSVDIFNAMVVAGTFDQTKHQANAIEKLIDDQKAKNLEKIGKNRENFGKNLEEFSKLNLKNPEEYKKAEDLLGKEVAQKTKNMSNEEKEAYLEKHKEKELNRLDMAEKIVEISANGSKGKALHALASDPEIFNKKKENGEPDHELFEASISQIYKNNMKETLSTVNKGIETTLGNKAEIDNYLSTTKENADNCLRVSQENIKNKDTLPEGEKPKNEFYEYNKYDFDKAEKEPEEKVTYMTMKEALHVQNIAQDNEKERLASANAPTGMLDYRLDRIQELRNKRLSLVVDPKQNVTEMTRNTDGSQRTFGGGNLR